MIISGNTTIGEIREAGGEKAEEILKKHLGEGILEKRNIDSTHIGMAARNAYLCEAEFETLARELENL